MNRPSNRLLFHDLRNQLGIILGYCDLLLDATPPSDERHADIVEIKTAAEAAINRVNAEPEDEE
jgi:hypothetical protein